MHFATKLIAIALAFSGATSLFAQTQAAPEPRNVVQLEVNASLDVAQDFLTVSMTAVREGADPTAVQAQVRNALDAAVLDAKKTAQPQAMDVRTGTFSLQPRYGREGKITGWVGSAELVLEGRDFLRIGTAASRITTMTIGNVFFSLSREARTKAEAEAQETAIARFKAKASDIARGFGFSGYSLREVAVGGNNQNVAVRMQGSYAPKMASVASDVVPMEAGKTTVQVSVSGSVVLK